MAIMRFLGFFMLTILAMAFSQKVFAEINPENLSLEERIKIFESESENPDNYNYSEDDIQEMAKELNLDPNSRHIQRLIGNDEEFSKNREAEIESAPIVKHVRGKQGSPLPTQEQIINYYPDLSPEELEKKITPYVENDQNQINQKYSTPIPLPDCTESFTKSQITDEEATPAKVAELDILFIRNGQIPSDATARYGEDVVIMPYDNSVADFSTFSAEGFGVTCLPARVRATETAIYADQGKNALLNYSADHSAPGIEYSAKTEDKNLKNGANHG